MHRYLEFWPVVLNLAARTGRRATFAEALACGRRKRAEQRHGAELVRAARERRGS